MVCKKTITILLIIITIIMIMQFVNEYKEAMVMQRKAKASFAAIAKKAQTNPYNKQDTPQWGGEGGGVLGRHESTSELSWQGRMPARHGGESNVAGNDGWRVQGEGVKGKGEAGCFLEPTGPWPSSVATATTHYLLLLLLQLQAMMPLPLLIVTD